MVVAALAKPCGELTEEPEIRLLHGLARSDSELVAQRDSQAFVRRERLRYVAGRGDASKADVLSLGMGPPRRARARHAPRPAAQNPDSLQLCQGDLDIDLGRLGERQDQFSTTPEHVPTDHCPGFGDQRIERTAGVGRRGIAPQCVDQAVSRHGQQPRNYEVGEQQATLTSSEQVVNPPAPKLHSECPAQLYAGFIHHLSIAHVAYLG